MVSLAILVEDGALDLFIDGKRLLELPDLLLKELVLVLQVLYLLNLVLNSYIRSIGVSRF